MTLKTVAERRAAESKEARKPTRMGKRTHPHILSEVEVPDQANPNPSTALRSAQGEWDGSPSDNACHATAEKRIQKRGIRPGPVAEDETPAGRDGNQNRRQWHGHDAPGHEQNFQPLPSPPSSLQRGPGWDSAYPTISSGSTEGPSRQHPRPASTPR